MSYHFDEEEETQIRLKIDREHAKRLWGFLAPHIRLFVLAFLLLVALFVLELINPAIVRMVIDGPVTRFMQGQSTELGELLPYLVAFAGVMVLMLLGQVTQLVIATRAGQKVIRDLRVNLFEHILSLAPDYFDKTSTGRLVTRISNDCENLSELFTTGVVATLIDLIKIIGLMVALFWVSPPLAVILLFAGPLLIAVTWIFQHKARAAYRQVRGNTARLTAWFAEGTQGVRVARLFGQEHRVHKEYARRNRRNRDSWLLTVLMFGLFFAFVDFGTGASQAAILWRGGLNISVGDLSYGQFTQFWLYFGLMLSPIRELGEKYNVIQSAFSSAERIFHILDHESTLPKAAEPKLPEPGAADIRFEHVDFHYVKGTPVLTDVDFEIPAGGHIAIVGPTGAGKSTLIQLLTRFRDPIKGRVRVGGIDIRELDLQAHRRRIGVVLQDVFLFASDILENIRLWDQSIPESRVVEALEAVQALDVVNRLGGIHERVEERGATFSQGERQLLAFARALVQDPQILVLDEATSSIDTPTELKIQRAMELVMSGRTTLVIAHRLSTIRNADRILVVDGGRIVESGPHAQLLAHGGEYAKLVAAMSHDESA